MLRTAPLLLTASFIPAIALAQSPARELFATRVTTPIAVNGRLDEAVWREAAAATGFVQRDPDEGVAAPEQTEVRFLISGDAIYIGARMHSRHPGALQSLVARRDHDVPSEQLRISFDTRGDRTTAYTYSVTVGGVRGDVFHPGDSEGNQDESYDPVWQAATAVDSLGWTAELRIPLTQLRFNSGDNQRWGLNIVRDIPEREERSYWVLVRRDENGWSSKMGMLTNLGTLHAPARLELVPYIAAEGHRVDEFDSSNPFESRTSGTFRAGADLKLGLGQSLTLDATINPDFGQVEADPAEVNLSAFETSFEERRPFFVEGANLLGGRNTFYSRRIGAAPPGSPDAEFAEEARNSTILGAAKITGRLPSGLSLAGLTAVTAEERVRTFDPESGEYGRSTVAPLTSYTVLSAQQELGRDRSTVRASVTAVERDITPDTPLAALLARNAYTGLLHGRWRWAGGRYDISGYAMTSHISGDAAAILRQQRSSRRYYQRPDADYVEVDPTRTSLDGTGLGINHSKLAGNWLWDIDYDYASPGLELNDMGFLGSVDQHRLGSGLRYRNTTPKGVFRRWTVGAQQSAVWNTGGVRTNNGFSASADLVWKNFWSTDISVGYEPQALSATLTRGGPLMRTPRRRSLSISVDGPSGAQTQWTVDLGVRKDDLGTSTVGVGAELSFRPGTRWEISVEAGALTGTTARQYVATQSGGTAATFGGRYIFANVKRHEYTIDLRANFAITPDLTVEGFFEPFASSGQYGEVGELQAASSYDIRRYGENGTTLTREANGNLRVTDGAQQFTIGNPDFNVRSFRSNLVVRWEWRPGSTAYLVWQQDRSEERDPLRAARLSGLGEALGAPGENVVALKISYWLAR